MQGNLDLSHIPADELLRLAENLLRESTEISRLISKVMVPELKNDESVRKLVEALVQHRRQTLMRAEMDQQLRREKATLTLALDCALDELRILKAGSQTIEYYTQIRKDAGEEL